MIDWDLWADKLISSDGHFLVMRKRGEELHNLVDYPTTALLRALKAQLEEK
jgi:hypothetical protein